MATKKDGRRGSRGRKMISNALVCQAIYSKASLNSSNSPYFSKKKSNFINRKLDFNHERVMRTQRSLPWPPVPHTIALPGIQQCEPWIRGESVFF